MNGLRVSTLKKLVGDLPDLRDVSVVFENPKKKVRVEPPQINSIIPLPPNPTPNSTFVDSATIDLAGPFFLSKVLSIEQGRQILIRMFPRDLLSFSLVNTQTRDLILDVNSEFSKTMWIESIRAFFGPTTASLRVTVSAPLTWYLSWRRKCVCCN